MKLLASNVIISILVSCISTIRLCEPCNTSEKNGSTPLPSDEYTFQHIRSGGFLYIDKTPHLIELLNMKRILLYISRPRRFGKSSFLGMMSSFFQAQKEHFADLEIGKLGNQKVFPAFLKYLNINTTSAPGPIWIEYPVIHLDFSKILHFESMTEFKEEYQLLLKSVAKKYNIDYGDRLTSLSYLILDLRRVFAQKPVVILVDEFDSQFQKAVLEYENIKLAKSIKSFLNSFLGEIKANSDNLGLAFVMGVSRLPLALIQSGGNNFEDLTFEPVLATAFGLTAQEISQRLGPHLEEFANSRKEIGSGVDVLNKLIENYDGYRFTLKKGKEVGNVFNPVSTLKCLRIKVFDHFWSSTGSMDYVLQEFWNKDGQYHFNEFKQSYKISLQSLNERYDPTVSPVPLPIWMVYFGYATIIDYLPEEGSVHIKFPNTEIVNAIYKNMLSFVPLLHQSIEKCTNQTNKLKKAFERGIIESAIKTLRDLDFYAWPHPSKTAAKSPEITRRLNIIFNASGLNFVELEGVDFNKDSKHNGEDIYSYFLICDLPVNFIISVKCDNKAEERGFAAMQQLIGYTRDSPNQFWDTVANHTKQPKEEKIYFLSLGFGYESGGQLFDWVFVPYKNTAPVIDEINVDEDKIKLKNDILHYLNSPP